MKPLTLALLFVGCLLPACKPGNSTAKENAVNLNGTWQLVSGTTITKGVSAVTDYTKNQRMIKIINGTHFAFLKHNTLKDSALNFDAGGGSYTLTGNKYTEHLDFYNDRNWEGKSFNFTVDIKNDTLIQKGIEKVEKEGIEREIIEKYVRVKN
jgi:lipopolysaccharide export system protein LptA